MLEKTVLIGEYSITVRQATVLDGMRRGRLIGEGLNAEESDPERKIARVALYPAAMAALVTLISGSSPERGREMAFDDFCSLPEAVVEAWLAAVYELNPHWQPGETETAAEKKSDG